MATKKKPRTAAKKNPPKAPKKKKPRARHNPGTALPPGMVMVPAALVGAVATAAKKKKSAAKKGHKRPHKHNPEGEEHAHSHLHDGLAAVGFGTLAAVTGLAGGWALKKANFKTKGANIAGNIAAGVALGGGLGMINEIAGIIVAHNYAVAAGQWVTAPKGATTSQPGSVTTRAKALMAPRQGASANLLAAARSAATLKGTSDMDAVHADAMGEYEIGEHEAEVGNLDGVQADPMGGMGGEFDGFEEVGDINGVQADPMGGLGAAYDELGSTDVDGYESLGAYENLGGYESLGGPDDFGGYGEDVGDPFAETG